MTEIIVDVTRNHYHVKAEGHAGDPLICAGISVLTQMMGACIINHDECKVKKFTIEDGLVDLDWISPDWKVLEDTKAMTLGLLQLEHTYPEALKIKQNIL